MIAARFSGHMQWLYPPGLVPERMVRLPEIDRALVAEPVGACKFSHDSGEVPKRFANLSAISGLTADTSQYRTHGIKLK